MFLKKALAVSILTAPALMLSGCGGDGTTAGTTTTTSSVPFTLALTDGPVDAATAVVIELTGVSIKPKGAEAIVVEFDAPRSIDLLELQDGVVTDLISELELEPGDYDGIHLHINAVKDDVLDSYVELEDGTIVELDLQGKDDHGLHITKQFTLVEGEPAEFTIDFDLRKSLLEREGYVALKPHLHLVHNHHAGHLHGDLDPVLVADLCADSSVELGAVYVYSGADATPTDVNGSEADPIASALVKLAPNGEYHYHVGFLEAGEYTVAYTCDAASDNPEEVNELTFAVLDPITIEARAEHEHPFPPHAPHEKWDESVCKTILNGDSEEPVEETVDEAVDETIDEVVEETSTATETDAAEGSETTETRGPFPPHLKKWCENGGHEWHPAPGEGPKPVPPVDGETPADPDPVDEGETPEETGEDEEAADPAV
jgi:hypothetical protein